MFGFICSKPLFSTQVGVNDTILNDKKKNSSNNKIILNMASSFSFSSADEKKKNRIKINTTNDKVVEILQKIKTREFFLKFCNTNRDHLSFDLLYRLTVLKLKTQSGQETIVTKNLEDFRKRIQESNVIIDQPFTQSLILAEKRIKESLKNTEDTTFVSENIGNTKIEIACFWIVLNSALIAWKTKNLSNGEDNQVCNNLTEIKNIISKNPHYNKMLPIEMKFLDKFLYTNDIQLNLDGYDLSTLDGMKLLICYLEKLPSSSYGPILITINKIYKSCFEKLFKTQPQETRDFTIQFTPTVLENQSKIADIRRNI